ncbi:UNVERIFIED_CONTAM: hypothetical protein FKN15_018163 [Acipenser sinensis]
MRQTTLLSYELGETMGQWRKFTGLAPLINLNEADHSAELRARRDDGTVEEAYRTRSIDQPERGRPLC